MTPRDRIQQLRAHADVFAFHGADDRARMLLNLADELEQDLEELEATPIGRAAFAKAAGVHPDSVTRAVRTRRVSLTVGDVSKVQPHKKRNAQRETVLPPSASSSNLDRFSRRAVASSSKGRV
jgi:hypothetical protein